MLKSYHRTIFQPTIEEDVLQKAELCSGRAKGFEVRSVCDK